MRSTICSTGNDTLQAGAGDDRYIVDALGDVVQEAADEGIDTVVSAGNFTRGANLENLFLGGTASRSATGNALANWILGNSAANLLMGGAGNDSMIGGTGNDVFYVDSSANVLVELTASGTDTVISTVHWLLSGIFENLTFTGLENLNGQGNGLDNVLTGNAGNNQLLAFTGNDTLIGGAGADRLDGGADNDSMTGGHGRRCLCRRQRDRQGDRTGRRRDRPGRGHGLDRAFHPCRASDPDGDRGAQWHGQCLGQSAAGQWRGQSLGRRIKSGYASGRGGQ
jgi:Ca2+-binding RTX toxin-like protein